MSRRILILTDNETLYGRVRASIEENFISLCAQVDFACSLPESFLPRVDVKEQTAWLIENYRLIFSAHCRQIFPADLINKVLCVNLHPGFNPHNRGWFPHVFSIINGQPAGATLHVMDERIDHGAIIAQTQITIESFDTSGDVYRKILDAEIELFKNNFQSIVSGEFQQAKACEIGNVNSKQAYEELKQLNLDEQGSFRDFLNRLRALTHDDYRNAYFFDEKGRKIFVRVVLEAEAENNE